MTERAFLASPDEAQGLHVGSITRIMRVVDPQPKIRQRGDGHGAWYEVEDDGTSADELAGVGSHTGLWRWFGRCYDGHHRALSDIVRSPFGVVGDRLWLGEAWRIQMNTGFYDIQFRADMTTKDCGSRIVEMGSRKPKHLEWQAPETMPKWASRTLLDVTDVRVMRVREITDDDALLAGVCDICESDGVIYHQTETDPAEICGGRGGIGCLGGGHPKDLFRTRFPNAVVDANSWLWLATVAKVEEVQA